ncbi:DUF4142 domain-containing protein [Methylobacterium thuringiense]|uniref:DUF4142 domain-containing protein n=1 Tax=Methylobacterium thuringiense TaxID=1003091 RepID=A0ABQ4TNJ1_9HYPH|nr:DUF4142 domain-containing protein [Methylobacterium thuringiense]GJE56950.1 hypothetical protein EKPJFOCH_3460 [Methylobacterium thuringiense]
MRSVSLAALAFLIAAPAFAETVPEKTGVNSLLGVAPTTQDFVTQAAISDMFEIQSSKLAEERADDATKAFAKQMITDHEKVSTELKGLVKDGKIKADIPTEMDSAHASKIAKLKGLKGEDFTKQYHSDQETGHKNAVDLFKRYAEGGENADLKAWAAKTKPALDGHLKMADELNK